MLMQGTELPAARLNNSMTMQISCGIDAKNVIATTPIIDKEDIYDEDVLYWKMRQAVSGVRWKSSVGYFIHHYITEIDELSQMLRNGTYKPRRPRYFNITEPKPRRIMSVHIRDRIYLRALNDIAIYPQIIRSLIPDNFACQKGKGTDAARKRLREFLRSFYRKNRCQGYRLQVDIHGYYPNMNREFAKSVFRKRMTKETYPMAEEALGYHPGDIGFCPGDQTIQNVGIAALDDLDHFIKERLRIKYYIRYMDDFILLHPSKDYLQFCFGEIRRFLAKQYMAINPIKTEITAITKPILFLGFRYRLTDSGKVVILVDPKKIKHERRKLRRMVKHVREGKSFMKRERAIYLTKHDVDAHFKAYKATIRFGNSRKVIYNLNRFYENLWKGQIK